MIRSLSNRVVVLCAALCVMLICFAWLLLGSSSQTRQGLSWVTHSAQVLRVANEMTAHLQRAESMTRYSTLSQRPERLKNVDAEITAAQVAADELIKMTKDNVAQNKRATEVRNLVNQRLASLNSASRKFATGNASDGQDDLESTDARVTALLISARLNDFFHEERTLAASRMGSVEERLSNIRLLVLIGTPISLVAVAIVCLSIVRGIRRPVDAMMDVMQRLGSGAVDVRINSAMNSSEFERLAKSYNSMVDELERAVSDEKVSQSNLHIANTELYRSSSILKERGEVIEVLGGMAHRMQAARTDEELASIIGTFVPRVLPEIPGALYAHNNSRNLLVPLAVWGNLEVAEGGFGPEACWALRRGQSHYLTEPGSDIICAHVDRGIDTYHCEPLLAGGEVIGVLYLHGKVDLENRFRLTVLAENIASALVNHRLQRGLREQTIRDPLTGLFNRRYMEETLDLEIARTTRSASPLSLVMCDVDHFKRFNDDFGHDAGDAILQAVGAELRSRFRAGDVVCRFGGEEFTVIAPASTAKALALRVDEVRQAISELSVSHNGRLLGSLTMSFGIATWDTKMERDGSLLIKAADSALYKAKRNGRNQVVTDRRSELHDLPNADRPDNE